MERHLHVSTLKKSHLGSSLRGAGPSHVVTHLTLTTSSNDNGGKRGRGSATLSSWPSQCRDGSSWRAWPRVHSDCSAQLSSQGKPNFSAKLTLPPHPGAQTGKGRGCFGASTLLVSLLPSQAVKGAGDSGGKLLGWPPVVGRPCSSYIPYSLGIQGPGCSREEVLQWRGSGKVKRKRKDKREGGKSA